jgi:hypothetical protein
VRIEKLNPRRVLVKLAPVMSLSSIILTAPEAEIYDEGETAVVTVRQATVPVHGKVMMVGDRVLDVAVGDVVLFKPEVGEPCDDLFPTPHLLLWESQIDAVVPPREASA